MGRGAVRFFSSLRLPQERIGTPEEHLAASVKLAGDALDEHPDFLRLLIVLALQPPPATSTTSTRLSDASATSTARSSPPNQTTAPSSADS